MDENGGFMRQRIAGILGVAISTSARCRGPAVPDIKARGRMRASQ